MRRVPIRLFTALILLILSLPALALDLTGQLEGRVTDVDGLAVPGVTVNLTSPQMQGGRSAETGPDGDFRFVGLPPGDYRVEAVKAGFNTAVVTATVSSGLTTRADITLEVAVAGEALVVESTAPVVDTSSVRSGVVVSKQMLRDIPNPGRDYQTATTLAPGVVDNGTGNNNIRGSWARGNQYYVDGVNTTDPLTNTFSMNMNYDAIEEVQVITGGMDAEYGRSMGGAIQIVTRSGGNEYHGDLQFLSSGTKTQVYKPLADEIDAYDENGNGRIDPDEQPDSIDRSLAINFGGPVLKDELWFFTSVQGNLNVSTARVPDSVGRPAEFPMQSRKWRSAYLFGKLTWKPNTDHRIWIHAQGDPTDIENADADPYTLPSAENWWQQGGWLSSIGEQWTPNADTIVDAQISASNSYIRSRPIQWKTQCTGYDEYGWCKNADEILASSEFGSWEAADADGFSYGPETTAYYTKRKRYSGSFAYTRFAHLLGKHQLKTGLQGDWLSSYEVIPGQDTYGIVYYTYTGDDPADLSSYVPSQRYLWEDNGETTLSGMIGSWYVQDRYNPVDRLTIRPGLRVDYSQFFNADGESVFDTVTFAPRFGAAYDLTGDGRTRVHAYYGRFYDSGWLEISSILSRGGSYSVSSWSDQENDWSSSPSTVSSDVVLLHDDIKNPNSDEYDVGIARDLGGGWGLDLGFTYKYTRNMWEDDEVNAIYDETGSEMIGTRDGTGELRYRLRTPDEAFVRYTSVELQANKQFDEHWGMIASYTWSRAYGRARNDLSQGMTPVQFDFAPQQQYEVGLMPYDVPHSIKIAGSWREPWALDLTSNTALGYLFGWNYQISSGTPYRPAYYNSVYGGWYNHDEPIDGDYRLPAYSRLDLKAGLTIAAGQTTWDLTAECFNVFNDRTVTAVQSAAYDPNGDPLVDSDGHIQFGSPLARQQPRYFQFGLRGEF